MREPVTADSSPLVLMEDATQAAGIKFTHHNGGSGRRYYVETMSGGAAFLDYDGDGWQDIFLIQGAPLPGYESTGPLPSALYHNNRNGTFTDTTEGSGLDIALYGFAPAVGDYDNDGRPDLYVTALGGNRLFHNDGHGKFRDVTRRGGVAGQDWCTGAAWLDYDRDGRLDLFVCRYTEYSLLHDVACTPGRPRKFYCHPSHYKPTHSLLYHNNGDGTFTNITKQSGIAGATGRSLGVVCADLNGDNWIDICVANDMTYKSVFLNNGDGTFREDATATGLGVEGKLGPFAGMGVDCGDYQNDGRLDIVVTNFQREAISLYRGNGGGTFTNETEVSGIESAGATYLKWGTRFVDLDLDGFQDIFVVNGHVQDRADERPDENGYAQPCQVFRNINGRFTEISSQSGNFFARRQVGRGAAFGDYDNDGDTDVLIACNNQPAVLLRNDTPHRHHWIRLALEGSAGLHRKGCNHDALGALVHVRANGMIQTQVMRSGTSYMSDHDRRLIFGIGPEHQAQVEIRWPCGAVQKVTVKAGQTTPIKEIGCKIRGRGAD